MVYVYGQAGLCMGQCLGSVHGWCMVVWCSGGGLLAIKASVDKVWGINSKELSMPKSGAF